MKKKDIVHSKRGERGATLILVTFVATFVLIPIIGLAIDGTLLYWQKAKLSAAVDAAALAAGRSLNVGDDESAQEASATNVGQEYFAANFPTGTAAPAITLAGGAPTVTFDIAKPNIRTVTVSATAIVPLLFMPILHVYTGTLAATGSASRRDANVILLLDRSGSMSAKGNTSCSALIAAAEVNFVAKFANGRDRLGLVTFSTVANVDFAPTLNFDPGLDKVLDTLRCVGGTNTADGLFTAHQQLQTIAQPGALNVILLFTDGSPSSIIDTFHVKTLEDSRYGVSNTSKIVSTPKSGCSASMLPGVLSDSSADSAPTIAQLDRTGATLGLYDATPQLLSSTTDNPLLSAPGCSFSPNSNTNVRQDVAYINTTDLHGDITNGAVYPLAPSIDIFDSTNPYNGYIRPDVPRTIRWAAFNAADSQAQQIRADTTYAPVIYTIGLAGNETMAMDQNFMERLANDPRANNYDSNKPQGMFKLATDQAGISQAFNEIASLVLHLSH